MTFIPKTAMVLAAGLGTRMRPLTDDKPKPLVQVRKKALIDYTMDRLVAAGVQRAIVNVHYFAEQIEDHLSKRSDIEVIISDERGEVLETGGALAKARPVLGDDPIYVCNTDAFWGAEANDPLRQLAASFNPAEMDICMLLADRQRSLGFHGAGDFFMDPAGLIKRRGEADHAPWAYTGVRIIKPTLYNNQPVRRFSATEVWAPLLESGRIRGSILDAFWLHVGDPQAVKDADMWMACHGL